MRWLTEDSFIQSKVRSPTGGFHLFSGILGYVRAYSNYQITWLNCNYNTKTKKSYFFLEESVFLA
ncbi:hypothetical protein [Laspinema palackyanum]|uniref:hypothetical protein n=1 Tax=Laspinema palackyanum TaxID=3231601 RepID=UPI00349F6527